MSVASAVEVTETRLSSVCPVVIDLSASALNTLFTLAASASAVFIPPPAATLALATASAPPRARVRARGRGCRLPAPAFAVPPSRSDQQAEHSQNYNPPRSHDAAPP